MPPRFSVESLVYDTFQRSELHTRNHRCLLSIAKKFSLNQRRLID
jgi:hypothetical protein